jgi:predicted RNA-binding protein YlqC (UPF0109 family)
MGRVQQDEVRNLLLEIMRCLVDDTGAVRVECIQKGEVRTLNLSVSEIEVAKIYGVDGHVARSIRTILSAAGTKLNRRYQLNIQAKFAQQGSGDTEDGPLASKTVQLKVGCQPGQRPLS